MRAFAVGALLLCVACATRLYDQLDSSVSTDSLDGSVSTESTDASGVVDSAIASDGLACVLGAKPRVDDAGGCGTTGIKFRLNPPTTGDWQVVVWRGDGVGDTWLSVFCPSGVQFRFDPTGQTTGYDCSSCTLTWPSSDSFATQPLGPNGIEQTWNGAGYVLSACGARATPCLSYECAQMSQCLAVMCACRVVNGSCASNECVQVPFDFPACSTVVGTLQ